MAYSIEPAYLVNNELTRLLLKAGTDPINKWFFTDGAFSPESQLERVANTWLHENFVVITDKQIIAYFEAYWSKPLNIITSFRLIVLDKKKGATVSRAIFDYFEYLFVSRGCKAFNWIVAEKNYHAHRLYEKFINHYFGHNVGIRHNGQMAYNNEVSDVFLYEITSEEYFEWKNKTSSKS